jgi:hypothetical protein
LTLHFDKLSILSQPKKAALLVLRSSTELNAVEWINRYAASGELL